MQNFDQNIGFWEKRHFFAENWQKSQKNVIITSTPGKYIFYTNKKLFYGISLKSGILK
jgi:hypothetical protein